MTNSRAKGCRGEREVAEHLRDYGYPARRGQQFAGGTDSPDVVGGPPGWHIEVKRVEAGNPYNWMEQAVRDAGDARPVVIHRRSGKKWLAIMHLDDWLTTVAEKEIDLSAKPV